MLQKIMRALCTEAISLTCCVKIMFNRSFININALVTRVFALPKSKIFFRAKTSIKTKSGRL
jgi:hypothetical protein